MRLRTLLLALTLALLPAVSAKAAVNQYSTSLFGSLEATPNLSPGVGVALVTVDTTSWMMRVQAAFNGLEGLVTVAHIHCCTASPLTGESGVATPTPTFPDFPANQTFGFYDRMFDLNDASSYRAGFVTANTDVMGARTALIDGMNSGRAYFNIHSSKYTAGEIRGFLQPVPEPGTYALMLAGLGLLGVIAVRRRRPGA